VSSITGSILAIFPYLVAGSSPLAVMRELLRKGTDVTIARYLPSATGYTMDQAADFVAGERLLDLHQHLGLSGVDVIERIVRARACSIIVQAGSPWAYAHLARVKERMPSLRVVDLLYNTGPHFHSFASYERVFDDVIVESAAMFAELTARACRSRIHKVESGVDLGEFAPRAHRPGWNGGVFTLGYVGRLSPEKNPLGFIALAERIAESLPWVRFAIFGQGPLQAEVIERLERSPVTSAIRFGGFVRHPTEAYGAIDALLVPSILDGRPVSVMEASACGVPVLGASVGGIPELIEDGRNGYVVGRSDAPRIIEILSSWADDPEKHSRMRYEARVVAELRFDRRQMMDAYYRTFRDISTFPARAISHADA